MPTQMTQKKEKKDYKQELLEQINKQYGLASAAVMDKAFKTQDKQIEQAMMEGGARADDIAQTKGIKLDLLGKLMENQSQVKAVGESPISQEQQGMGIQSKPASSPFGFGGMSMQNNQITEQQPGLLAGLLSTIFKGSANASANADLKQLIGVSQIQQNQQQGMNQGVYEFDPYEGGVKKVTEVPKGSIVRNRYADPSELIGERTEASKELFKYKETGKRETEGRVQMASNLDVMEGLLGDMETYINENPNVFIKGLNPLAEREFKAILSNYDKVAAIAAGGKQLTKTELDLIRHTRPTILDTKNPKAIAYKFRILKSTLGLAKERLNKGTKYEEQPQTQQGWTQDKESRYQELLKKRGK